MLQNREHVFSMISIPRRLFFSKTCIFVKVVLQACPRNGNGNSSILKSFWENIQKLNINEAFPFPFRRHAMAKRTRALQFVCSVATPQFKCFLARRGWQILC